MGEFAWVWVLIPVTAIVMKTIREFLRFKATQRELGTSTDELEREVAGLKRTNATLADRLQNLEAIVVSQTWDALHDPRLSPTERDLKVASAATREFSPPDTAARNEQQAAQLAQRLRG
jgi:predicted mannosyl-3-phosphoglycerate phosphatase (HAD superfamily)